eukprot:TRINITY_DN4742_c0_g1_i1.p1 TRINITY_DN4742_c0_g1~~TRINITY_DN4742_c0_g1_i1.p1  ORF type:complete len:224 (-),score=27.52 TRINITY_DN4742_c0_g1_i1:156-827(-)
MGDSPTNLYQIDDHGKGGDNLEEDIYNINPKTRLQPSPSPSQPNEQLHSGNHEQIDLQIQKNGDNDPEGDHEDQKENSPMKGRKRKESKDEPLEMPPRLAMYTSKNFPLKNGEYSRKSGEKTRLAPSTDDFRDHVHLPIGGDAPIPRNTLFLAIALLVIGLICLLVGLISLAANSLGMAISFLVIGIICSIPGSYYTYKFYMACKARNAEEREIVLNDIPQPT